MQNTAQQDIEEAMNGLGPQRLEQLHDEAARLVTEQREERSA